jgi:hypothetical protein
LPASPAGAKIVAMSKKGIKTASVICVVVALLVGGFGGELSSLTMIRVANAVLALWGGLLALRVLTRPPGSQVGFIALLLISAGIAVAFAYFVVHPWPTAGIYEVIGDLLDEAL